jgi:hypothetical protein
LSLEARKTGYEGRSTMRMFIAKTAAKRATGDRPSRTKAFAAATATAFTLGIIAYKILRSGD